MKKCIKCQQIKSNEEFYNNKKSKDGLHSYCKVCNKFLKTLWANANPEKIKRIRRQQTLKGYGLSFQDYENKLKAQKHGCEICGTRMQKNQHLSIDHNHKSGKVRGLLCRKCNSILGRVEGYLERVKTSIAYLEKYK